NAASGTIGPPTGQPSAIAVTSTGTLTGGIANAGRIVGLTAGSTAIGIGIAGEVRGGISNSGTITVNATHAAGFIAAYGVDVGQNVGSTPTSFGGGLSNGGTISVTARGTSAEGIAVILEAST